MIDTDMDTRCLVCKRQLKAPKSVARGIGPVCFRKLIDEQQMVDWLTQVPCTIVDAIKANEAIINIFSDVISRCRGEKCTCGEPLIKHDIACYDHADGIDVAGFSEKQWVFLHCRHCGNDAAIWKLIGR